MVSLQPIPIIRPSHLPQIIHIHWHDNHGNRDEQGTQENYDRTITLEVFTNRSDAKASAIKHKNLWTNLP